MINKPEAVPATNFISPSRGNCWFDDAGQAESAFGATKKKEENKEKGKKEKLDVVVARDWGVEWVERCRGCYGSQVAGTNTSTKVLLHTGARSVWLALYLYTESDNSREPTSGRHIL